MRHISSAEPALSTRAVRWPTLGSYIDIYKLNISSCLSQQFYRDQSFDAYILYIWEVDLIQYSLLFTLHRPRFIWLSIRY